MIHLKEVEEFLNSFIKKDDCIVFACSGGPDSMCLLELLWNLKQKKSLKLICAHVNHKQRKESEEEWAFVHQICNERGIIFEGLEINSYSKNNFHDEAHKKRKIFYEQLIKKYQAKYLMTGHHGDDLLETILMRLTRGSSLSGYKGFKKIQSEKNYQIIRPLITVTKEQIKEYNHLKNIVYYNDSSNEKDKYTRNRYRHHILPFLKKENKNVHLKFLKFSEEICRINEFIVKFSEDVLTKCLEFDNLHIVEMTKYDEVIQREIIKKYLYNIYHEEIVLLNEKHIDSILNLIHSKKSNKELSLPNGWKAKKEYDFFKIEKDYLKTAQKIELQNLVQLESGNTIEKVTASNETNNFVLRLNSQEIAFPIQVRYPLKDDKIVVKNFQGHQKVNRIFIDKKIPKSERMTWPILVDNSDQILWIPGLKKSQFDREINEEYDIIYKYNLSKERIYAKKK